MFLHRQLFYPRYKQLMCYIYEIIYKCEEVTDDRMVRAGVSLT